MQEYIKKLDEIVFNSPRDSFFNDCTIQDVVLQKNNHGIIKLTKEGHPFEIAVYWENPVNEPMFFMSNEEMKDKFRSYYKLTT